MRFDWMKRRDFVALLGGAAAWPIAARAHERANAVAHIKRGTIDPRITPARPDLAAKHLAGLVDAARFAEGKPYDIAVAQAPVRKAPTHEAPLLTEALKGERITVYDMSEDGSSENSRSENSWAWGQLAGDGYVGFLPSRTLAAAGPPATHKVSALRTFVFPGPSIKLAPIETLSFGCQLDIARLEEPFAITASGGHVPLLHLTPVETRESDFVAVAERFVGTPYLWGGKTSLGIDCSGLLQLALAACGIACPRDSDMQEQALGSARPHDIGQLQRGDLLFWKGHVAIARDRATLVHANASHMAVTIEPIPQAITRIRGIAGEITSVRRLG
jgi:NlpC/P60 family/Bacterial dipeptidyl-peptidase Sh3 domain